MNPDFVWAFAYRSDFILVIIIALVLFSIPTLLLQKKIRKQIHSWRHINDYEPTREDTFKEKIEKAKMQPKSVIIFGQNNFACDNNRKKLLVQSAKTAGVLLDYKDIVSYELIKDGQTIRRGGEGESVRVDTSKSVSSAGDEKPLCSDLKLVIKTRKASSPEVVLPFISFSIDSEFAYNEALQAASEAAEELERVI